MKTYWFTSGDGEDFFVEESSFNRAKEIAITYFGANVDFHKIVSEEWAEMQGWDTY